MNTIKHLMVYLLVFTFCFSCQDDDSEDTPNESPTTSISIEKQIFELVNKYRKSKKLAPFKFSEYASQLCKEHNTYMISKRQINHDNFDSRYKKLQSEVKAIEAAENVADGYIDAPSVMEGWLNSTGHRKNIEGNYTHIGINAKKDNGGNYYYTQIFYK